MLSFRRINIIHRSAITRDTCLDESIIQVAYGRFTRAQSRWPLESKKPRDSICRTIKTHELATNAVLRLCYIRPSTFIKDEYMTVEGVCGTYALHDGRALPRSERLMSRR